MWKDDLLISMLNHYGHFVDGIRRRDVDSRLRGNDEARKDDLLISMLNHYCSFATKIR